MVEIWESIKGYKGLYEVSSCGRVRSLPRNNTKGKILKPIENKDGYFQVTLSKNNNRRNFRIHRLVATAFLTKAKGENVINHKDENKKNNQLDNLEWCTVRYNNSYNNGQSRRGAKRRVKVVGCKDGKEIFFNSVKEASKITGAPRGNLSSCLTKNRKSAGGYTWRYADE